MNDAYVKIGKWESRFWGCLAVFLFLAVVGLFVLFAVLAANGAFVK